MPCVTETQAALLAAVIGALSALMAGGMAGWVAFRQVARAAESQRRQTQWERRSDDYASFIRVMFAFRATANRLASDAPLDRGFSDEVRAGYFELSTVAAVLTMRVRNPTVMDAMMSVVHRAYEIHTHVDDYSRVQVPSGRGEMDRILRRFEAAEEKVRAVFGDDLW